MPNIEIDFQLFLPSLSVFYSYFEILKQHEFVKDVEVVQSEGLPKLRVHRLPGKFLSV
ncbi:MAG: hypothetical protein ACTSXH_14495 [Promethearchaeota archaeon]